MGTFRIEGKALGSEGGGYVWDRVRIRIKVRFRDRVGVRNEGGSLMRWWWIRRWWVRGGGLGPGFLPFGFPIFPLWKAIGTGSKAHGEVCC